MNLTQQLLSGTSRRRRRWWQRWRRRGVSRKRRRKRRRRRRKWRRTSKKRKRGIGRKRRSKMTRTRRRWGRRREPGLLLLLLSATFSISLPFLLYFGCQLVLTFFPTGHQPPFSPGHFLFFFFLPSRSWSLCHVNPQQPLQSGSPSVCLLAGGVCHWVTASLSNWSDAAALIRRQASARTSQLAQHFFLSQQRDKSE